MNRYILLTADNRIGASSPMDCMLGAVSTAFPADFDFEHQMDYKVIDGALVYDPIAVVPGPSLSDQLADLAEMVVDNTIEIELLKLGGV